MNMPENYSSQCKYQITENGEMPWFFVISNYSILHASVNPRVCANCQVLMVPQLVFMW
jgi:hypothetical protein